MKNQVKIKEFNIVGRLVGGDPFTGHVHAETKAEARWKCENNTQITSWKFVK
jgi:hypothetical protein